MPESRSAHKDATSRPRVTVFIPAFNAERYIGDAIESVLAQTYPDFELLIIDDGSTDASAAVICSFETDPRLRAVSHIQNLGQPRTRNHGLEIANGEYIAFLDADDRCIPERIARQVAYLDTHADIDGVGSWMAWMDENGHAIDQPYDELPLAPERIACHMLVECPIAHPTMMLRASALSGYRYNESFAGAEDYELWARMIVKHRFANVSDALVCYRRHAGQATIIHGEIQKADDLRVYQLQLSALGVCGDSSDLIRHECLFKFEGRQPVLERTGAPLDIHYLRWARAWLEGLLEGNTQYRIYPEPAFSQMLAERWLFACRKAARNSPLRWVAREFFASPLRRTVASLYAQRVRHFFTTRR